jgi:signal peptidase I
MKQVVSWGAFALVIAALFLLAGPSSIGGPASYVIVDGRSMEPTYEHGDLVVAYERNTYAVGDTIVYDAPVDSQFNVIHRIIDRTNGGFITQGDNRDEPDGWIAPDDEIYGAALFHIPNGGAIVNFLRQPTTILAIGAGWVTLILMERSPRGSDRNRTCSSGFTGRQKPSQTPQRRRHRSDTSVSMLDATTPTPRTSRTAKKAAERAARRKKRGAVATLSLAVLVGGSGGIFFAHAAFLSVDAGVLQAFTERVDIDPPPPPEDEDPHAITVEVRFFDNGKNGDELGSSPVTFEPVDVPVGGSYTVDWNGPGNSNVIDCDSDSIQYPGNPPSSSHSGVGTFTPEGDSTHVLCVQTAPGKVPENIDLVIIDADDEHTEIELVEANEVEEACEEDDPDEACGDASKDEPDDADSQETEGLDVGGADDTDEETTDASDADQDSSDTDAADDEAEGSNDTDHEDGDDPDDASNETDDPEGGNEGDGGDNEKEGAKHETEDKEDGDEGSDDRGDADNEDEVEVEVEDAGDGNDGDAR